MPQQGEQRADPVAVDWPGVGVAGHGLGQGVGEDRQAAAAHDELVEGVKRADVDARGLGDHHHVDVILEAGDLAHHRTQFEEAADAVDDRRRRQVLGPVAEQGQIAKQRDHRFFGGRQVMDQARQVIFQKARAFRRQMADHLAPVGGVGGDQAQVKTRPGGVGDAFDAGTDGQFLGRREGRHRDRRQA